ncbi:MAG: hypothetical protein LH478_06145 [Chitinophagaceae bacterium]|nr:hypothetical protein [Chitinophagaceae bacterium]
MLKLVQEYYFIFGIIPVIFYLFLSKRINDKALRVIIFLLLIDFGADLYSIYQAQNDRANYVTFNLFNLVESLLLFGYFYVILISAIHRSIIIFIGLLFIIVFFFYYIRMDGSNHYLDVCAVIENILIIFLAIVYFFTEISKPDNLDFQKKSKFWVVCSYLIYSAGTLFLFLYINTLPKSEQQNDYVLNYIFLIPKSILLSIAMFIKNTTPTRKKFQLT